MSTGEKIAAARERMQWTQQQLASAIKVPRSLIAMWESNTRIPNLRHLEDLAAALDSSIEFFLGMEKTNEVQPKPSLLFRGLYNAAPNAKVEIEKWLRFLDDWSSLLTQNIHGRSQAPKAIDKGPDFRDLRSSSKLALAVRNHYGLGFCGLPDLYTFLDEQGVLVYKARLGSIGSGKEGISGAYYNHPSLGSCILVNTEPTWGRQMFTLAHEFAHGLFHYGARDCIVSLQGENSDRERFADAFASHFLVPAKGLKETLQGELLKNLDEFTALWLAHYFNVSYAFMLNRLEFEGYISSERKKAWQSLRPSSLARYIGLDPWQFERRADLSSTYLSRYPVSVLKKVRELVERDHLFVSEAATLLGVDSVTLQSNLLQTPEEADEEDLREVEEFAETN